MANVKRNDLVRVSLNLPVNTLNRIQEYAERMTISRTAAIVVLCNMALDQQEVLSVMPKLLSLVKEEQ